jgi:hypothetical protein
VIQREGRQEPSTRRWSLAPASSAEEVPVQELERASPSSLRGAGRPRWPAISLDWWAVLAALLLAALVRSGLVRHVPW